MTVESIEEAAARIAAEAPPLTEEQRRIIRGLFAPVVAELRAKSIPPK